MLARVYISLIRSFMSQIVQRNFKMIECFLLQKTVTFICCCFFLIFANIHCRSHLVFYLKFIIGCMHSNEYQINVFFFFYKHNLWMIKMLNVGFFFHEIFLLEDFYAEYILCLDLRRKKRFIVNVSIN